MRKIFLLLVFLIIVGAGLGFWYFQSNQFSKEDLKLEILGSEEIEAGEEIEYLVKFKNNGQARMEEMELIFDYPANGLPAEGGELRQAKELDALYPGEERIESFKGILLAKEGEIMEAKALITYKYKNLKAPYDRETGFITKIKSVPLTFDFDLPLKTEQGEKLDFALNYFSQIDYLLDNLRIKITYPDDFTFLTSKPSAIDKTEWALPSLVKAQGGRVQIEGVLEGQEGSQKMFQAELGIVLNDQFIVLKQASHLIELIEPSLYISQLINSSQNYIANPDELLHYEIFFKNIGQSPIQRKFLFVKLESPLFDLNTVASDSGEVGRGDDTILFDWKVVQDLRFLDAGQEGKVDFWVRTKPQEQARQQIKNPLLLTKITLGGAEKNFQTKINSALDLSQKVYFTEEVFGNSGPLPLQVGQATTYTVFWQLKNYWNEVSNVKVKTTLPENVIVTGQVFPEDSQFTYDSLSKEVVWSVGALNPFQGLGQGEEGLPLTLAFQIELLPSAGQKGSVPWLVALSQVSGQDSFTLGIIQSDAQPVDATLPDDSTVSASQGKVE